MSMVRIAGVAGCLCFATLSFAQTKRALLIGINTYQPAGAAVHHPPGCQGGRCDLLVFDNLRGAVNDVRAMRDLLASPKFGFLPKDIVVIANPPLPATSRGFQSLPASQARRDGMLAAMKKYLVDKPQRGDTVVFYFAGHGSLRVNSKGGKLRTEVNGEELPVDSTLVAADAYTGNYDPRDRELTRIFQAALDKGIHLTVILDACHTGATTRGVPIGQSYRERRLPVDPRDIQEAPDTGVPPTERTDNPALVFSAAQQTQTAKESPPPDSAKEEPHGAFTLALIEALRVLPADAPASLVYQKVKTTLEGNNIPAQDPELDATAARRQQPLFGGAGDESGKVRTAALGTEDGSVLLDIGRLAGIGPGSEFTSISGGNSRLPTTLRVTQMKGVTQSLAEVVQPAKAEVQAGDVFELSKWAAAPGKPLGLWMWPANLTQKQIMDAAAQIQASGANLVEDPAEQPWTDMLTWNGLAWQLQHAGSGKPAVSLGANLNGGDLKRHLPEGSTLWANLPPAKELSEELDLGDPHAVMRSVADVDSADYIVTGNVTPHGPAYAWFHTVEFKKGPPERETHDHSPGCSTTSSYPVRSDWVAIPDAGLLADAAEVLNKDVLTLAKIHDWIELSASPTESAELPFYRLVFQKAGETGPVPADRAVTQDDVLQIALQSDTRILRSRWIYVLEIDCHGRGSLIYPIDYDENQFPKEGDTERYLPLTGAGEATVGPPYGVDTIIMLYTAEPITDPYVINFAGVSNRGTQDQSSPFEQLLSNASAGTRGGPAPNVPTEWGITLTTLRSKPKDSGQ